MKLVATANVRSAGQPDREGSLYVVDLENQEVLRPGTGKSARSQRGIAFDGGTVYLADAKELAAYTPAFSLVESWRNPYLDDCREIAIYERTLYLVSAGCDSILGFDLDARRFHWAMHVAPGEYRFAGRRFDPHGKEGPLLISKLDLDSVHCNAHGMYIGGQRSGGMLHFNGESMRMAAQLPPGAYNAQPFRDGVLFNDSEAGALRYAGRGEGREDRAMRVPTPDPATLIRDESAGDVRQGFARGLCVLSDTVVAGGSSPATVTVYDLAANRQLLSVRLSRDVRQAIHSIAVWPYD